MELGQLRSQFTVDVVDRDGLAAKTLCEIVQAFGFGTSRFFPTYDSAKIALTELPPHLILVAYTPLETGVEDFLAQIKEKSPETLVILTCVGRDVLAAMQLVSRKIAYDYCVRPFISSLELAQKIDRGIQMLYHQYESEQLAEFYSSRARANAAGSDEADLDWLTARSSNKPAQVRWATLTGLIDRLSENKDLEGTLQLMVDGTAAELAQTPVLYLKYISNVASLMLTHAAVIPAERFRGVGVDLRELSGKELELLLQSPEKITPLRAFLREVFQARDFVAWTHVLEGSVVGVVVILAEPKAIDPQVVEGLRQLLNISYSRNHATKLRHALDVYDPLTGLYNRRHFLRNVEEEISRSRRILLPTSLLRLDIAPIAESKQAEIAIRAVGNLLRKSTRINDLVARIGPWEFAAVLPHTPFQGGLKMADRFCRAIASSRIFPTEVENVLAVYCGVGEYPRLASDSESLLRSTDGAAFAAKEKGKNQICLVEVAADFASEFNPVEVPSSHRKMVM